MYKPVIVTVGMRVLFAVIFLSLSSVVHADRLEVQTTRGIAYISGGVGIGERDALRAMTKDYSLRLSFAQTSGSYLSGVDVEIQAAGGATVLQAQSNGPWFFADLPTGKYTVRATMLGKAQQKVTRVTENRQKTLYFYW